MDDSDGGGGSSYENDDLISHIVTVSGKRRTHKERTGATNKQKRNRKLAYSWDRQAESALIAAVEKRPPIWDTSCKLYKNPNVKPDIWKQVATELNIGGVDDLEARLKWQALRSHFKAHIGKLRARKSDHLSAETHSSWPHLSAMMFIESNELAQSCPSTSRIKTEYASTFNDITPLRDTQSSIEAIPQTPVPKRVRRPKTPRITPSPSCSWYSNPGRTPPLPDEISEVGNIAGRQEERYDLFGRLVALHLRRLPQDAAFNLEGRIMQMIYSTPPTI